MYYVIITPTTPKPKKSENSMKWQVGFETQSKDESRCFNLDNNILNLIGEYPPYLPGFRKASRLVRDIRTSKIN